LLGTPGSLAAAAAGNSVGGHFGGLQQQAMGGSEPHHQQQQQPHNNFQQQQQQQQQPPRAATPVWQAGVPRMSWSGLQHRRSDAGDTASWDAHRWASGLEGGSAMLVRFPCPRVRKCWADSIHSGKVHGFFTLDSLARRLCISDRSAVLCCAADLP
jgi:hypothetical protein